MRPIGFSTGAIARGDFHRALGLLGGRARAALELSALRRGELPALLAALGRGELDLAGLRYVSLHAPSRYEEEEEEEVAAALLRLAPPLPVVLHPDAVFDFARWEPLGERLLIENMDRRKRTGQTAAQLAEAFTRVPHAGLCLDVGHVFQVDPTLREARDILRRFGDRLRQLHLSEVDAAGQHRPLGPEAMAAFQRLAPHIPRDVPIILEAPVAPASFAAALSSAAAALP